MWQSYCSPEEAWTKRADPGYGEVSAGVFEMPGRKLRVLNEEYLLIIMKNEIVTGLWQQSHFSFSFLLLCSIYRVHAAV